MERATANAAADSAEPSTPMTIARFVLEAQCLPDCDQARGSAVDAAEDAFENRGFARLYVHRHVTSLVLAVPLSVSRMELDRAAETEAERLLERDVQEAKLLELLRP